MLIGIEAERANHRQKTGVEHYAKQLILNLAKIDTQNQYILYLRTEPEEWFFNLPKNFKIKVMPFPIFWTQIRLSWEMLLKPVDALLIPASALPIIHPKKSFAVIHDVGFRFFPETFTWFMRNFLEWSTRFALRHAYRIITISHSTKNDLVKFYSAQENKIRVVYLGFETESEDANLPVESFGAEILLPQKFLLFLSTLQPRKNLEKLIDAFRMLKNERPELPHKLAVVGKPGWKFQSILKKLEDNKDIVLYLNYVSDEARSRILSQAEILVQPSLYEGFGMQILEAFAHKVPVAASRISSIPEVAGDAAAYFDPLDPKDIKKCMETLIDNEPMRIVLVENGHRRLRDFSWEKCARETLAVFKE